MSTALHLTVLTVALALPGVASACGGFFCDASQPVTQAAERILFAPADEPGKLQMHVQLTYGGPPAEFGWLLPVPRDVTVSLSNALLFQRLDQVFGPQFRLTFEDDCEAFVSVDASAADAGGAPDQSVGGGPDVQILSREAVGPYDQVIIAADESGELLRWLNENDFNAPQNAGALLQGYIDNGSVFVALKLLPSAGVADVSPIRLEFTADQPVIPIKPTQVAAEPDMGLIVHVVGAARAVPTNYLHVTINERAIDWFGRGANYADVVSQAADEADGQAFATDFAGAVTDAHRQRLAFAVYDQAILDSIRSAETLSDVLWRLVSVDEDVIGVLIQLIVPPEGITVREMLNTRRAFGDHRVDGAAIADAIDETVNPARVAITVPPFAGLKPKPLRSLSA
ncbi:MAG: hypothetical protein ACI9U2_003380 [Bradymonadia bacterium]|jgi:hypothetical protein